MVQIYAQCLGNADKKENESFVYRAPVSVGKNLGFKSEGVSVLSLVRKRLLNKEAPLLGQRHQVWNDGLNEEVSFEKGYKWITCQQVFDKASQIGSGLLNLRLLDPKDQTRRYIGFYSQNSLNYLLCDVSCLLYGFVAVPIYDTLGEEATLFAFEQTQMQSCFSTVKHLQKILKIWEEKKGFLSLKNIIILDEINYTQEMRENSSKEIQVFLLSEIMQKGSKFVRSWPQINNSQPYCICYTSGTTGNPWGSIITHRAILSVILTIDERFQLKDEDVYYSILPLAHVMERAILLTVLFQKGKIGFFTGNIHKMKEDVELLKPTIILSVPRILNRLVDTVKTKIKSLNFIKKQLISQALNNKLRNLTQTGEYTHLFYDKLFSQIWQGLGGRVWLVATGSAPISQCTIDFIKVCFSCPVIQGYGFTEGLGVQFATYQEEYQQDLIGGPFSENEFKLVDVPELNYYHTNKDEWERPLPQGELWVRGPNVSLCYFKELSTNEEQFTLDGWFKTGDIAQIQYGNNALKIIDRKKNIFKLCQGEYIVPEPLENIYKHSSILFEDVFVYGDSLQNCLLAVVFISQKNLQTFCQENQLEIQNEESVVQKILQIFDFQAKSQKLNGLQKIKGVIIESEGHEKYDFYTTTMKKKRHNISKHYKERFDQIYSKLNI